VTQEASTSIWVRRARPDDATAIVAIKNDVVNERRYTLVEPEESHYSTSREAATIIELNRSEGSIYLVAEREGRVVGFLDFVNGRLRRTRHSGMFSIYLAPSVRGEGIGTALIAELLNWATIHPFIDKVTLAVFSTNDHAIALYKKMGFEVEGICSRDVIIDGMYVDSILMYKFTSSNSNT
jgi:RimJ/RimL family protein N-acetyltransferase